MKNFSNCCAALSGWSVQASRRSCFCRYRDRPLGALLVGIWAPGSAARPSGGFYRRMYIHNRDFYLSPFPYPCVITPPASLLKWMEVRTFHIFHRWTNILVVIVTAVKSELVPSNQHPNFTAVKTNQEKGTCGGWSEVLGSCSSSPEEQFALIIPSPPDNTWVKIFLHFKGKKDPMTPLDPCSIHSGVI